MHFLNINSLEYTLRLWERKKNCSVYCSNPDQWGFNALFREAISMTQIYWLSLWFNSSQKQFSGLVKIWTTSCPRIIPAYVLCDESMQSKSMRRIGLKPCSSSGCILIPNLTFGSCPLWWLAALTQGRTGASSIQLAVLAPISFHLHTVTPGCLQLVFYLQYFCHT